MGQIYLYRRMVKILEALPESSQEVLIVDDLISLILGGKAAYFTFAAENM